MQLKDIFQVKALIVRIGSTIFNALPKEFIYVCLILVIILIMCRTRDYVRGNPTISILNYNYPQKRSSTFTQISHAIKNAIFELCSKVYKNIEGALISLISGLVLIFTIYLAYKTIWHLSTDEKGYLFRFIKTPITQQYEKHLKIIEDKINGLSNDVVQSLSVTISKSFNTAIAPILEAVKNNDIALTKFSVAIEESFNKLILETKNLASDVSQTKSAVNDLKRDTANNNKQVDARFQLLQALIRDHLAAPKQNVKTVQVSQT